MARNRQNITIMPLNLRWVRGFTFIELIVAVALSVILMRGMYVVFYSATNLTTLSEQKSEVLLEASAIYEYISRDIARIPYSGTRSFDTGAGTYLLFRAVGLSGGSDVYIKYSHEGNDLKRSVYTIGPDGAVGPAFDENGDGVADEGVVVSSKVTAFAAALRPHPGSGSTGAVAIAFTLFNNPSDPSDERPFVGSNLGKATVSRLTTFYLAFPVLWM